MDDEIIDDMYDFEVNEIILLHSLEEVKNVDNAESIEGAIFIDYHCNEISGLNRFTQLRKLTMECFSEIRDVGMLYNNSKLESIQMTNSSFAIDRSSEPLHSVKALMIDSCPSLPDVAWAFPMLEQVTIIDTHISSLSALADFKNIRSLFLYYNAEEYFHMVDEVAASIYEEEQCLPCTTPIPKIDPEDSFNWLTTLDKLSELSIYGIPIELGTPAAESFTINLARLEKLQKLTLDQPLSILLQEQIEVANSKSSQLETLFTRLLSILKTTSLDDTENLPF